MVIVAMSYKILAIHVCFMSVMVEDGYGKLPESRSAALIYHYHIHAFSVIGHDISQVGY